MILHFVDNAALGYNLSETHGWYIITNKAIA